MKDKSYVIDHRQKEVVINADVCSVCKGKRKIVISATGQWQYPNRLWLSVDNQGVQIPFEYLYKKLKEILQEYLDEEE